MILNLTSVLYKQVVTTAKQRQVNIDNVWENARRVTLDYTIGDRVYVEMTGIYWKLFLRNKDRIESQKSLQTVQFDSEGGK